MQLRRVVKPAGRSQGGRRGQQARPRNAPRLDFVADHDLRSQLGRSRTDHTCETRIQHDPRIVHRDKDSFFRRGVLYFVSIGDCRKAEMTMRIDQAWNHCRAACVHLLRVGRPRRSRPLRSCNSVARHQHVRSLANIAVLAGPNMSAPYYP